MFFRPVIVPANRAWYPYAWSN